MSAIRFAPIGTGQTRSRHPDEEPFRMYAANAGSPAPLLDALDAEVTIGLPISTMASAWKALFFQVSHLEQLFDTHHDVAAVEFLLIKDQETGRMHLSGVPQAWTYGGGKPAPYIPNITGAAEISALLWSIGSEAQAAAGLGELDPLLIPGASRQTLIVSRLCGIARSLAEAPDEEDVAPPLPCLRGFCDMPETAHMGIVLRQTIRSTIDILADIIGFEICRPLLRLNVSFPTAS